MFTSEIVCRSTRSTSDNKLFFCSEQTDITLHDHVFYDLTWVKVLPHGMFILYLIPVFLGLVIFQKPLFSNEVGPYVRFQRY